MSLPKDDAEWPESDLLEAAWGLIANVGQGNWDTQTEGWKEAATRWREGYHRVIALEGRSSDASTH